MAQVPSPAIQVGDSPAIQVGDSPAIQVGDKGAVLGSFHLTPSWLSPSHCGNLGSESED